MLSLEYKQEGGVKVASIIYQTVETLKRNVVDMIDQKRIKAEKIPTKKHAVKQLENPEKWNHLIFAYKTYDTYKNRAIVFAKFCKKEFGIKQLNEITPAMTKAFFEKRLEEGKTAWTLHGDRAALVKLENCLKQRNWISDESRFVLPSEELNIPDRKKENRIRGGLYTDSEIDAIEEEVSESTKKYIKFVRGTGARIKGASTIKKKDIYLKNGNLLLKEKNGYPRIIPVSKDFQNWLKGLIEDKEDNQKVLPVRTDRNVQKQIRKACLNLEIKPKGIHRLRATFANNMYNELRKRGYTDKEAKKAVSEHLGHHRVRVIKSYLPEYA